MNKRTDGRDVFIKIDKVRNLLSSQLGNMSDEELQTSLCHCWYFKFGRKKELTEKEYIILDLLLKNGLSPKTVYHWFLLNKAPEHIKDKLTAGKMSLRGAISESYDWRTMRTQRGCEKLMDDMKTIIGGLNWKSQEK